MKQYSNLILSLFLVLTLQSCSDKNGDSYVLTERLVERNDTTYQVNSTIPFSGTGVDSTENQLTLRVEYGDGLRNGRYQEYHLNTQLKKEGEYEDGFKTGEWKTYYDNGQLHSVVKYLNGKEKGVFKSYFRNGSIQSEIVYKGGTRDGTYKKYHQNGVVNVDVRFSDGLYDSRYVELTSSQDTILTVDFTEGTFNGRFVVDINQYNSKGDGSELFDLFSTSVGSLYSVSFDGSSNYNLNGDEKLYLTENDISYVTGFFKGGERDGRWVVKNGSKTILEVGYKEGVKDGEVIKYFPLSDTIQLKGSYDDGSENGLWKVYHPNGEVKLKGEFKDGESSSVWTENKSDGTLWRKYIYDMKDNYKVEVYDEEGNITYTTRMWY